MDVTIKNTSVRCDIHPPLSAIMYCDGCRQFLCRICAEVRPGGRVCSSCKKPCREPSVDEFSQLMIQRQKAKENAVEAKAAEARNADQMAKAKLDREARLKAEFTARKAALAQQQSGTSGGSARPEIPPIAISSSATGGTGAPQMKPPVALGGPVPESGGTMYNPNAPSPAPPKSERDPLAKLGERAHLNVIGRAKSIMLIFGILTMLTNGIMLWWVSDEEQAAQKSAVDQRDEDIRSLTEELSAIKGRDEKKKIEAELARLRGTDPSANPQISSEYSGRKTYLGASVAVGALLIVLVFLCEHYPRAATTTAFVVFLIMSLFGFAIRFSLFGTLYRWSCLVALYNGMQAGQELHKLRVEAGEDV